MLNYPELLIWEHFFHDSLREVYQMLNDQIKSINSKVWFGLHIWHNNSFNPLYRAEQDLSEITKYTDFLKMVMYHNAGGPRMAAYIDSVSETTWGDVPKDELLQFHYRILNYDEEPYDKIRKTGLKNDYIYREAKRAVEGAAGAKTLILPGVDIGIHGQRVVGETESTPEGVKKAVIQVFQAGVDGIILSRKYSEMELADLGGAGAAIEELGLA